MNNIKKNIINYVIILLNNLKQIIHKKFAKCKKINKNINNKLNLKNRY